MVVYHHNPMSNQKVSMLRFQCNGFNVILYRAYVEHLCSFSFSHPNNIQFITYDCVGKAFVEHLCSFSVSLTNNIQFITYGGGGLPPQSNVKSKSVNVTISMLQFQCYGFNVTVLMICSTEHK